MTPASPHRDMTSLGCDDMRRVPMLWESAETLYGTFSLVPATPAGTR